MDLLRLERFLAVVEEGTFTRAAERVSRTQPAVSQSIKKLEEQIESTREPIKIIRHFNWDAVAPALRPTAPSQRRA